MEDKQIFDLFYTSDAIDVDGRVYLCSDRNLAYTSCLVCGVASYDGSIYFSFGPSRFKRRSIVDKRDQRFNRLTEGKSEGFKIPFFNQKEFHDKSYIIITEGEFDCIAVHTLGKANVVSLPNGASSARKSIIENFTFLQQFEQIYLCFDNDKAGDQACQEVMKHIPPKKYRRIKLPYKDANELLIEELDAKEIFEKCFNEAERIENPQVKLDEETDTDKLYKRLTKGMVSGFPRFDKILQGLRPGEITVVTADTGVGKTTFCINLIFNLLRLDYCCWVNSYEMNHFVIMRKFCSLLLKKELRTREFTQEERKICDEWIHNNKLLINPTNSKADIPTIYKSIEHAVYVYDCKCVLIDHLDYITSTGNKDHLFENVDDTMRDLHALALEFNVHILLVVHPKQIDNKSGIIDLNQLKGSSGIKQYADNVVSLCRMDRVGGEHSNSKKVLFKVLKNRMFGKEGEFDLNYVAEYDGYMEI